MTDLCFARPMLDHVVRQAATMDKMMKVVGVNPLIAVRIEAGAAFFEARSRCIDCRARAQCRGWLAATRPDAGTPPFCPNTAFFATCLAHEAERAQES